VRATASEAALRQWSCSSLSLTLLRSPFLTLPRAVLWALQRLFARLVLTERKAVEPREVADLILDTSSLKAGFEGDLSGTASSSPPYLFFPPSPPPFHVLTYVSANVALDLHAKATAPVRHSIRFHVVRIMERPEEGNRERHKHESDKGKITHLLAVSRVGSEAKQHNQDDVAATCALPRRTQCTRSMFWQGGRISKFLPLCWSRAEFNMHLLERLDYGFRSLAAAAAAEKATAEAPKTEGITRTRRSMRMRKGREH